MPPAPKVDKIKVAHAALKSVQAELRQVEQWPEGPNKEARRNALRQQLAQADATFQNERSNSSGEPDDFMGPNVFHHDRDDNFYNGLSHDYLLRWGAVRGLELDPAWSKPVLIEFHKEMDRKELS